MRKRIMSLLMAIALVIGLMPGMSLTAYADGHTHDFEYSANGDTITATCKADGCNLTDSEVTLTIGDPTNIYWDDKSSSHEFTLVGLEAFNSATGKTISASDIVYYKGDNQSQDIKNNTVKGTTYKARLTVEGVRAEHSFKFTAKPIVHTHSFSYSANGNIITATCTSTTGNCDLPNKKVTLTLNAPEHTTYDDGKNANATFTGEIPGVTNPTIHYSKGSVTLGSAPTDAGTYTAWCQLGNATARVEYTIGKASNNGWTTLPKAVDNLVYTRQPQDLITAGVPSAGNALYTVGTDPDKEPDVNAGGRPYSGDVPKMTDAGTYYVWCKIDGGKNYTSISAQPIKVTIEKATINPSVSLVGWTYGATPNKPMVSDTDNPGNGEVTYTYKAKGTDDDYSATVPTDAGDYTVKAVVAETKNYKGGEATADFTIGKAELTVTAKDQNIYVRGTVPDLSSPVQDTHYTVKGLVGEDTLTTVPTLSYQKNSATTTPDNTKAGTYDIVPSAASAGDNYTITYANGTLTISEKGTQTITAEDVNATYGDTDKSVSATVTEPTEGSGAISYDVKEGSEEYIDVDASTGALTIKKVPADGKAYVIVTASETEAYNQATKDVTVTISHLITEVEEVPATCTEDGVKHHWEDETGALYNDADGTEETTAEELKIPAINHDWNEPTYEWAEDNGTVTATRICRNDESHVETETVKTTSKVTKAATCEDKGETTYTTKTFENEAFAGQTKTVDDIDALNHDWNEPTYEWAEDNSTVTATRICKNDASHIETETAKTTSKVTKDATEAEEGETTYTATFKNPAFTEQTKTESIPKLEPEEEVTYSNTKGNGTQWTKGSTATADFTFKRSKNDSETFSHFTGIQVDGKDVAASNYTVESGSVIVKLKPSYLETLSVGEHTLTALFDDGNKASAKFTVVAKKEEGGNNNNSNSNDSTTPKTGDTSNMLLWFTILCASILVLFNVIIIRRRNAMGYRR